MSLQPGERFGRYELVSWLGRGGMAETYRARLLGEAGVTKPVLIKKVLPEYTNDQAFIAMFISEARISATLSHGNIAQVYDFGRVDGDYFLAMEYVDGQPLHRVLKRARKAGMATVPVPLAAFIALEMCRGLHYAHTRADDKGQPLGIVHRDISPDNVLISYEGQVKIVDFGIAKARELRGFSTEPGIVKGKYLFFSPEQAAGEEVDARTDVWATGIVLYELLCGQLPVEDSPDVAMPRLMEGKFPRPRELNPKLPEEVDAIVMQALAVRQEDRYESCHAFGDALATFLAASAPRFSAMSLSHFVQELFREDIASTGRQAQVPDAFREQFAQWRGQSPTALMSPGRARAPSDTVPEPSAQQPGASQAPTDKSSEAATRQYGSAPTQADTLMDASEPGQTRLRASRRRGGGVAVAVLGVVLLVGALAGGFFWMKRSKPAGGKDPSNPQPLQLTEAPLAPPPEPASPEPASPEPAEAPAAVAEVEQAPELAAAPADSAASAEPSPDEGGANTETAPTEAVADTGTPAPALSKKEQDARAAYDSATKLYEGRNYAQALAKAQRCVALTPKDAECHRMVGAAYSGLGQFDKAMGHYRKFLALAPHHKLAPQIRKSVAGYAQSQRKDIQEQ
ncbi:serine/threonine protein kinase [Hyalangium sp.]|uniref:serine/threonine protein kinase n=1 Tax=Hyalangium sp. TaxID=2028555 RepID=UPI002D53B150|nr:protein kinase [Hyalangium sp.]HYH94612.1 protein kinase [Hyalangium sp.]